MKKLASLIVGLFFVSVSFAQDNKMDQKTDAKSDVKVETKATAKTGHDCYMVKDGALIHCMGDKTEAVTSDVKLKNGTTLSAKGEMTAKDGAKTQLENGQCVSMMGSVGDCEKMHAKADDKMHNDVK